MARKVRNAGPKRHAGPQTSKIHFICVQGRAQLGSLRRCGFYPPRYPGLNERLVAASAHAASAHFLFGFVGGGGVAGVPPLLPLGACWRKLSKLTPGGGGSTLPGWVVKPIMRPINMTPIHKLSDSTATALPARGADRAVSHCETVRPAVNSKTSMFRPVSTSNSIFVLKKGLW